MLKQVQHDAYEINREKQKHIWHPLTQHKLHPDTIAITKAIKECKINWVKTINLTLKY